MTVAVDERGGGLCSQSRNAGIAIRGVTNQREIVRDERGRHAELRAHSLLITDLVLPSIYLDDAVADNALR